MILTGARMFGFCREGGMSDLERDLLGSMLHHDKENCAELSPSALVEGRMDLIELYDILTRSLNEMSCEDDEVCIWKERVRSSINRTILDRILEMGDGRIIMDVHR